MFIRKVVNFKIIKEFFTSNNFLTSTFLLDRQFLYKTINDRFALLIYRTITMKAQVVIRDSKSGVRRTRFEIRNSTSKYTNQNMNMKSRGCVFTKLLTIESKYSAMILQIKTLLLLL